MNDIIKLLSTNMSNMIAAGEVIERPVSVVKELVENSLDAKATRIEINLLESGIKEIEVIDNGIGMTKNDLKMSLKRHATSKINTETDLFNLRTLGFRGEAIPSIASISKISLASKSDEDKDGYQVVAKASNIIEENSIPMNKGTIITVNQLFYNTPARLKYLKSTATELAVITDLVEKLALSNPNVYFKLTNDKKVILQTSGKGNMLELISSIYGLEVGKNLIYIEDKTISVGIKGYISNAKVMKSRKNFINFVVNGRLIKNFQLTEKVISSYQSFIPIQKYPVALIFIEIDPFLIDVNIHPTKKEIKFSNERVILDLLEKAIKDKLFDYNPLADSNIENKEIKEEKTKIIDFEKIISERINNNENNSFIKEEIKTMEIDYIEEDNKLEIEKNNDNYNYNLNYNSINRPDLINIKNKIPFLEYIGQYRGTYLLYQDQESLYLLDQHAAQERIKYETCLSWLDNLNNEKQDLLFPFNVELSPSEFLFIKDNLDKISELGLDLEISGNNSFFIRTVPLWFKDDLENNIDELIKFILNKKSVNILIFKDELAKSIACKASIKANQYVNKQEAIKLIEDLNKCINPFSCPHGRPVFVKITNYELEKMFKRVI